MSSKQFINISNKYDRVVVLVDMDCFYCQVEEKLNPEIRGKPIAVVQYNPWQGGGIIAVNYPARAKGVTRHMRGDEAKQHCPDIVLPQVPQVRGKADISKYRDAGKEVAAVLQTFTPLLERASVDEAYMDITERVLARLRDMNEGKFQLLPDKLANTFAVGYESVGEFVQKISGDLDGNRDSQELESEEDRVAYKKSDIKLLIGASIVNEIRAAVKEKTGYECSAGIAHNKILAKLTAGFHKPNKQTILPLKSISKMYQTLSIKKVKGLGGKLGDQVCELLKIQFMSELTKFPEKVLQTHFEERMGSWMYLMAKGIDLEAVTPKFNAKSIGCCKRFPGKNAITGLATLKHWLSELANEIQDRLEKDMDENNRIAKQMTVSYAQQIGQNDVSSTRSVPLVEYVAERIAADALEAIKRNTEVFLKPDSSGALHNPVKFLGISAGKFEDNSSSKKSGLKEMFSYIANKAKENEAPKDVASTSEDPVKKLPEKKDIKTFFKASTEPVDTNPSDGEVPEPTNNPGPVAEVTEDSSNENQKEPKPGKKTIANYFAKQAESKADETSHEQTVTDDGLTVDPDKSDTSATSSDQNTIEILERDFLSEPSTSGLEEVNNNSKSSEPEDVPSKAVVSPKISASLEVKSVESINQEVENMDSHNQPMSNVDYRQTYAEYYRPLDIPQPAQKPCPECGKDVPESELQSHLDFHLALQLSQQQRQEFRNAIKSKFSSPAPAVKPKQQLPTTSKAQKPSAAVPQIDKFLTATMASTSSASGSSSAGSEKCAECGRMIPTAQMQEHLDYHTARKLQIELNQMEMRTVSSNDSSSSSNGPLSGVKRKRPVPTNDGSSGKRQPAAKVNSLSSYFTKM